MRRLIIWLATTATIVVLALGYRTSLPSASTAAPTVATTPDLSGSGDPTGTASGTATGGPASGTTSSGTADGTFTGKAVSTRYGPVQVQITVAGGKMTAATAIEYPTAGRDKQINGYAVPKLNAEAVAAQTAGIHAVSGATYTSNGYVASLQSAIDQANL